MKKESKHINDRVKETVLWVNTLFKGKVTFCGSFGLVLNGKLDRRIHDIDCITDVDHYGKRFYKRFGQFGTEASASEKFTVDGVEVRCFKIFCPNGMTVDVMYRDGKKVKYKKHFFANSAEIKVEEPDSAIEIKTKYLKLGRTPNPESAAKHQSDIDFITGKSS